jgi:regulator of protease activity HflC (stomatin/prohibitin superfamily)
MVEANTTITGIVVTVIISLVFIAIFLASRYYKFKPNEFILHIRNGKVRTSGRGGHVFKLPLIDEIVVIPTTTRQTLLNSREKILSREYQDMNIVGMLYWRVENPSVAFNAVVWDRRSADYVENIISTATEAIIRTTCASLEIEKIIRDRTEIIQMVTSALHNLTADWGIIIESFEILEVNVLDAELKKNMEAVKKANEEKNARLASANAQEAYRLREIEVAEKVGMAKEATDLQVEAVRKDKEIKIAELDRKRVEIQAETRKKDEIISAEAAAESVRLRDLAKMKAEAEGIQAKLMAEAEGIKAKMSAQADGLKKQAEAISAVNDKFVGIKLIESLPEVFANLKPDKMYVMGEGSNSFGSLVQSILPFLDMIPEISSRMKTEAAPEKEKKKV